MAKLVFIIVTVLLSVTVDYTVQDLILKYGCKGSNSTCISSAECCSGICYGKCIGQCRPVNAACNNKNDVCCTGLQCEQSTTKCCRLPGQTTLTPSECCSLQWIPNTDGCGGKCAPQCQPVNAACEKRTDVCCNGLQCEQSTKKCCRLSGQTALTPSECCSQQWLPNRIGCGGTCTSLCQPVNATCDQSNDVCCDGLQCNQWAKKCCRPSGQMAQTQSECCSQSWIANPNGASGGKCCSQHGTSCTANSDCCSNLDSCSDPQWPNLCV